MERVTKKKPHLNVIQFMTDCLTYCLVWLCLRLAAVAIWLITAEHSEVLARSVKLYEIRMREDMIQLLGETVVPWDQIIIFGSMPWCVIFRKIPRFPHSRKSVRLSEKSVYREISRKNCPSKIKVYFLEENPICCTLGMGLLYYVTYQNCTIKTKKVHNLI